MEVHWFILFVLLMVDSTLGIPYFKIVNGHVAKLGDAPYATSVRYRNCHECGGSIIGDRWVLTAAHCIFPNFINVSSILYGTTKIQNCQNPVAHVRKVKRAIQHPDYQAYGGYLNDIGLLEVEEPFEFDFNTYPVQLAMQDEPTPDYQIALLVGWGYFFDNGTVPEDLQKVNIEVYPDFKCLEYFDTNFSVVSHICAGGHGKGQCTGDSGGALTVDMVQYGIVSWSDKPCATTPGVLTRVASFREWITYVTGL